MTPKLMFFVPNTEIPRFCFLPPQSSPYHVALLRLDLPLTLHMLLNAALSFIRAQGKCEDKPSAEKKPSTITKKEAEEMTRVISDCFLGCDGFVYTCGISNLAFFRHLTNQASLASSSLWQSPATGLRTNFSSCKPSITGNHCSAVHSIGFLERIEEEAISLLFCFM